MTMTQIAKRTSMIELAALVSEALETAGIVATLSGGGAVSIYSNNRYQSADLDFVTTALREDLACALEPLGFAHTGVPRLSVFEHPDTHWYLEFPPAPLAFGGYYVDVSQGALLPTPGGRIRIITPTHSVMDRLIAAAAWHEAQSLDQAILVATHASEEIDWTELDSWVVREEIASTQEVVDFYKAVRRPSPSR